MRTITNTTYYLENHDNIEIRKNMKSKKITTRMIAQDMHVGVAYINMILRGDRPCTPNFIEVLRKLKIF